jgi:hypothetical protein
MATPSLANSLPFVGCEPMAATGKKGGNLKVLTWARQNGCIWDAETTLAAADEGYLDVLEWTVGNGCVP